MPPFPDALRRRMTAPLPGLDAQLRMAPNPRMWPEPGTELRPAAALLLVYPRDGRWHFPLTVRGAGLRHHTSQVSLPGGRLDRPDESVEDAALREAQEEIGVTAEEVDILGRLTPVPIAVSSHLLQPVVGVAVARPAFMPAMHEVERLIEVPVESVLRPEIVGFENRVRTLPPYGMMRVPYFEIDGARVWGATAMVLSEFVALLEDLDLT